MMLARLHGMLIGWISCNVALNRSFRLLGWMECTRPSNDTKRADNQTGGEEE